ncbi:unnamed protein product, partial [Discosporangium mesarthrocarpum]
MPQVPEIDRLRGREWVPVLRFIPERRDIEEFRSCRWLRNHDPASIEGLLMTALRGQDRKAQLAAVGTLLAVVDLLAVSAKSAVSAVSAVSDNPLQGPAQLADPLAYGEGGKGEGSATVRQGQGQGLSQRAPLLLPRGDLG